MVVVHFCFLSHFYSFLFFVFFLIIKTFQMSGLFVHKLYERKKDSYIDRGEMPGQSSSVSLCSCAARECSFCVGVNWDWSGVEPQR